jgi:hypothetical protein
VLHYGSCERLAHGEELARNAHIVCQDQGKDACCIHGVLPLLLLLLWLQPPGACALLAGCL